ncbi:MAG: hypothetical protein SA339_06330 [Methanomassiliicoccus sp.]|nr:hypothetical protein [Methanomassiliicoccus sp.]
MSTARTTYSIVSLASSPRVLTLGDGSSSVDWRGSEQLVERGERIDIAVSFDGKRFVAIPASGLWSVTYCQAAFQAR